MAQDLVPGEKCIVASYSQEGDVVFDTYVFEQEKLQKSFDDPSKKVRVFYGKHLRSVEMPKKKAAKTTPYKVFFNRKGHFKRVSVVQ